MSVALNRRELIGGVYFLIRFAFAVFPRSAALRFVGGLGVMALCSRAKPEPAK